MATTIQKQLIDSPDVGGFQSFLEMYEVVSCWFWFLLSLTLFVILGPFATPIALITLAKLGLGEKDLQEPEHI